MAHLTRRDLLRRLGAAAGAAALPGDWRVVQDPAKLPRPSTTPYKPLKRPLNCVILGHGGRGSFYASMSGRIPDEWNVVGVAEPVDYRNEACANAYGVPESNRFPTWERVFDRPKWADVIVVSTPDHLHYGPAMAALEAGYDVLLEKAVAQSYRECRDILELARKKGAIVAVCHVLRYAPYFVQMHAVVRSGMLGELLSIQHMEPVEHIHMSHSFVRGNWRNAAESTPMILSKSCHDLDILRWLVDRPCASVSSFGSLGKFRSENAPEGAPSHCYDGCPVEAQCPYHARKVYLEQRFGIHHIVSADRSDGGLEEAIRKGQYGRCVYRCDNDVVDHQIVNIEFEGGITAAFSMEGLTSYGGRRTRIMGTAGDLVGDERYLDVYDFSKRERLVWDVRQNSEDLGGHGGGDFRMVRDFIQAVERRDPSLLSSNLEASMESHLMGFQAEKSRLLGGLPQPVAGISA